MARSVLVRHATQRTEVKGGGTGHDYRWGYSWCDPEYKKKIAASRENDWRGGTGIYAPADQTIEDLHKTNCPECSRRWGKAQMEALAGRVTYEKMEEAPSYQKTAYKVSVDGILRGYIMIAKGFGQKWSLHKIKGGQDRGIYSNETGEPIGSAVSDGTIHMLHKSSVDGLACLFPALIEAGKLPTPEEMLEEERVRQANELQRQRERDEQSAKWAADRAARAKAEQERRDLAREAVTTALARAVELQLPNSVIAGLDEALKIIG